MPNTETIGDIEKNIAQIKSEIEKTKIEHDDVAKQLEILTKTQNEAETKEINKELEVAHKALAEEKSITDNDTIIKKLETKINALEEKLKSVRPESERPSDFQDTRNKLSELKSRIERLEKDKNQLSKRLDKLKQIEQEKKVNLERSDDLNRKVMKREKMQDLSNLLPNGKFNKKINSFIESFRTLLQGDPEDSKIIEEIQIGLENFNKNIEIRTSLCQMTLALSNPTSIILEQKQRNNFISTIGKTVLKSIQCSTNVVSLYYKDEINKLYKKIDNMEENTPTENKLIRTLLNNLRSDLDSFISSHQDQMANQFQELYKKFRLNFYARLHSQDVALSKHKSWQSFAINLFLGVITMGVALGIKAIHSKYSTGQVTLFARKTDEQEKIESMDQSLKELGNSFKKK